MNTRDEYQQWAIEKLTAERDALAAQVEALRGIKPELPPRPPHGDNLPRYGIKWNGDRQPITTPMDDGYWTPYHLAQQHLRDGRAEAVCSLNLDAYDAGYLNDFGGGNIGWWQDYMRSELGAAHDFYQSQIDQYAHSIRQEK